ncbi:MAG: LD-carboxypeptidase [Desulfobulbaceae bacterium]|nr:LD-carboxypeptidase [Desulfobulbaceae bacterium]
MKPPIYPTPLKKGDTIGIIAPAGQLQDKTRFMRGIGILHEMGFQVKFPRDLWPGPAYLADSDDNRGHELNRLFRDEEIKGLVSMRGGYGCLRILDKIDISSVRGNPKILVGFSDITILQNYLYEQTGLVSFHGPVVTSLSMATDDTLAHFYSCLTRTKPPNIQPKQIEVLRSGPDISAPLLGGNLASLVSLLGTCYDFPWDNKIIFLEDINEPPYKIDRMLTQLKLAGKLDSVAGLILGDFSTSTGLNETEKLRYRESVWERVLQVSPNNSMPIWGNFPSGHCPCNLTFPLGAVAEMNRGKTSLIFR